MRITRPRNPIPPRLRDAAIAGVWLIALEIENLMLGHQRVSVVVSALVVAVMALAAIWRRRAPLTFVAVVLACATVLVASWTSTSVTVAPLYILIFVPYTVARERAAISASIGLVAVLAWGSVVNVVVSPSAGNFVGTALSTCAAWGAGRWLRVRRMLDYELERKAERIEAERESRVRLAVADERTRIARELHALVAANVSAMVIQAEAAESLLATDLGAADQAMVAVERTGRGALSDMRRLVGVLRHAGESVSLAPQPGVGQIYALVESARSGGRAIELSVEGDPGPLPASVDLGIYRILEEALGPDGSDSTSVWLAFRDTGVELEVIAARRGQAPAWPTVAMQERTAICTGSISSEPYAGGQRLLVTLPRGRDEVFA